LNAPLAERCDLVFNRSHLLCPFPVIGLLGTASSHHGLISMTVCIAALSQGPIIFCAADRMVTADDQYEPPQPKMSRVSDTIWLMPSGDLSLHSELVEALRVEMEEWFKSTGLKPELAHCAEEYAKLYSKRLSKEWELRHLMPQGLSVSSFHTSGLDVETRSRLSMKLDDKLLPSVSAIFFGSDGRGFGVWNVENNSFYNETATGFSVIGSGARHAYTQLRISKQSIFTPPTDTLWNVYFAKRRAEIAPYVGSKATDVFFYTGAPGAVMERVGDDIFARMEELYRSIEQAEQSAQAQARADLSDLILKRQVTPPSPEMAAINDPQNPQPISNAKSEESKATEINGRVDPDRKTI